MAEPRIVLKPEERQILLSKGISAQAINFWTRGGHTPSKRMSLRVSAWLKRPVLEVLYGRKAAKRIAEREAKYAA
jgi:hypothetical protein